MRKEHLLLALGFLLLPVTIPVVIYLCATWDGR